MDRKLIYTGLKANLPASRQQAFYLTTDTREVYFGENLYTEAVRFFTSTDNAPKPTNPAVGVLYIDKTTGNGYSWNGTAWETAFTGIQGIKDELIGDAENDTYQSDTIWGAKKYADKKHNDLLGTTEDTSATETVRGARKLAGEKVAGVTAGDNSITIGGADTQHPTVAVKLSPKTGNDLTVQTGNGEEGLYAHVPTISVVKKATATDDFAASYELTVDGTATGDVINIPKDYLVKSATVDVVTAADKAAGGKFENNTDFAVGDKYLDFVVNTKADGDQTPETDTHIYINVADLAHIYTEGNGIDIDANDVVSVVIDGSNANGLSVGANGIALALATATNGATPATAGAMSGTDKDHLDEAYAAVQIGTF